jgi:pilus assembly protein Flp/PilA
MLRRFLSDDSGATVIEYGLIASLIGEVLIGAVTLAGTKLSNAFIGIANNLN